MNRPGAATGVNFFTGDLGGKRLELLCAMVPSAHVVGLLVNPRFGAETAEQQRQARLPPQPRSSDENSSCRKRRRMPKSSRLSQHSSKPALPH